MFEETEHFVFSTALGEKILEMQAALVFVQPWKNTTSFKYWSEYKMINLVGPQVFMYIYV